MAIVKERSVGLVLLHVQRRRILMLRCTGKQVWVFPKGHLEPGESDLQAVKRELLEEAAIRLPNTVLLEEILAVCHEFQGREGLIRKDVTYYLARLTGSDIPIAIASDEAHEEACWWRIDAMLNVPYKYPGDAAVVDKLKEMLGVAP